MDDKQTVRVTILSRPYSLRVSGDPSEVEALLDANAYRALTEG